MCGAAPVKSQSQIDFKFFENLNSLLYFYKYIHHGSAFCTQPSLKGPRPLADTENTVRKHMPVPHNQNRRDKDGAGGYNPPLIRLTEH